MRVVIIPVADSDPLTSEEVEVLYGPEAYVAELTRFKDGKPAWSVVEKEAS